MDPVFDLDAEEFRRGFNRKPFVLQHSLANHSAFDLEPLIRVARETAEIRPSDLYYDEGNVAPEQKFVSIARGSLPIEETIRRIRTQGAWIMIWRADLIAPYGQLLNGALSEIFELTGREIERTIKKREVILFVASPNRVTPYHIDRECNFLLQVRGKKRISLFSRDDREVLPEVEIEKFWACDNNAAQFRQHLQHRALEVEMQPGTGVHIPVNSPHWVQNYNDVSVTVSMNFQFHDSLRASAYRANYYMRKIGLRPRPPVENTVSYVAKTYLGAGLNYTRRLYRGPNCRE